MENAETQYEMGSEPDLKAVVQAISGLSYLTQLLANKVEELEQRVGWLEEEAAWEPAEVSEADLPQPESPNVEA